MAVVMLLHISFFINVPYMREDFSLVHYVYLALLGFMLQHFPVLFVSLSCKNSSCQAYIRIKSVLQKY